MLQKEDDKLVNKNYQANALSSQFGLKVSSKGDLIFQMVQLFETAQYLDDCFNQKAVETDQYDKLLLINEIQFKNLNVNNETKVETLTLVEHFGTPEILFATDSTNSLTAVVLNSEHMAFC